MTFGNSLYGARKKRGPSPRRVVGWGLSLILLIAIGVWSYQTGSDLAGREAARLTEEVRTLTETVGQLREQNTALRGALEAEQVRTGDLQAQYRRDVPDAETARIVELVRARRTAGIPADRLAEVIRAATAQWRCTGDPVTRRFILRTPLTTAAGNDVAGFANGAITVTGTGVSEVDAQNRPQAWYDPAQPVTLTFNRIGGGAAQDVTGKLPLYYSVVAGDTIYRFTAVPGDRSFVNVTALACAYP
ncbi:MAG: hypothetical protein FJX64_04095 [Alphaproteobacteria bacterium]|nr:hypothetical protein [Alphaproteobacteria bacterium]